MVSPEFHTSLLPSNNNIETRLSATQPTRIFSEGVSIETPKRFAGDSGTVSLDVIRDAVDIGALAISGLKRGIIEYRIKRATESINNLTVSTRIMRGVAIRESDLNESARPPRPYKAHELFKDDRIEKHMPITHTERLHNWFITKRQNKANELRRNNLYRMRQVWGNDIGTGKFYERMQSDRMRGGQRKSADKAHYRATRTLKHIDRLERRIQKAEELKDLTGRHVTKKLDRAKKREVKLNTKLSRTKAKAEKRKHSRAAR